MNEKFKIWLIIAALLVGCIEFYKTFNLPSQEDRMDVLEEEVEHLEQSVDHLTTLIGYYYLEKSGSGTLCDSSLLSLLNECDAYYPEYIMAQYELESAKGTSNVYRKNNNLFGMKKAFQRPTCRNSSEVSGGYASYYNWQLSVLDRVLWDRDRFESKPSREEYLTALKKIYAEDPNYVRKIEKLASKYVAS